MESLGEKLKFARVEKGLSLEQVCRETSISLRYLEALETEHFDVFPGEPYVIGFLKNYGNFLELDIQKLTSLYRALKIQEQPVPVEQLLRPKRKPPQFLLPVLLIGAVLFGIGYGVYYLILNRQNSPVVPSSANRSPVEHTMEGNSFERRFYNNDSILIPLGNEVYKMELVNLGDAVTIRTPTGIVILDLTQRANVDLNNNGIPDVSVTIIDFERNNPDMGVLLRFLMDGAVMFDPNPDSQDFFQTTNLSGSIVSTILPPPNTSAFPSAFPFTLQARFTGYCMFRWEILHEADRRDRNQRYFQRNDELEIQAQNGIRIWISNAQAGRFQVIGGGRTVSVELGGPGEVVVAEIRWLRDEEGRFRLVLFRSEA